MWSPLLIWSCYGICALRVTILFQDLGVTILFLLFIGYVAILLLELNRYWASVPLESFYYSVKVKEHYYYFICWRFWFLSQNTILKEKKLTPNRSPSIQFWSIYWNAFCIYIVIYVIYAFWKRQKKIDYLIYSGIIMFEDSKPKMKYKAYHTLTSPL